MILLESDNESDCVSGTGTRKQNTKPLANTEVETFSEFSSRSTESTFSLGKLVLYFDFFVQFRDLFLSLTFKSSREKISCYLEFSFLCCVGSYKIIFNQGMLTWHKCVGTVLWIQFFQNMISFRYLCILILAFHFDFLLERWFWLWSVELLYIHYI